MNNELYSYSFGSAVYPSTGFYTTIFSCNLAGENSKYSEQAFENANIFKMKEDNHEIDRHGIHRFYASIGHPIKYPKMTPVSKSGIKSRGHFTHYENPAFSPEKESYGIIKVRVIEQKAPVAQGAICFRLRTTAAKYMIKGHIPYNSDLAFKTVCLLSGRFDLLSLEEAEELGYVFSPAFKRNYFNDEELSEIFTIAELSEEITSRPKIQEVQGIKGNRRKIQVVSEPKLLIGGRKKL